MLSEPVRLEVTCHVSSVCANLIFLSIFFVPLRLQCARGRGLYVHPPQQVHIFLLPALTFGEGIFLYTDISLLGTVGLVKLYGTMNSRVKHICTHVFQVLETPLTPLRLVHYVFIIETC